MTLSFTKKTVLTFGIVFIYVLFSSCENETKSMSKNQNIVKKISQLDTILGDKVLNVEADEIRGNNFESLIGIEKSQLLLESELYNIEKFDENHFIIRQKKEYLRARKFDLLLKTNDNEVIDFIAFNDFSISDLKRDSTSWIVLTSDFYQTNIYWKSKQQIRISKLDSDLNEVWSYSRKSNNYLLRGSKVSINQDNYAFEIEVITGCHICFVVAELVLSKDGKFQSVKALRRENSLGVEKEELLEVFMN